MDLVIFLPTFSCILSTLLPPPQCQDFVGHTVAPTKAFGVPPQKIREKLAFCFVLDDLVAIPAMDPVDHRPIGWTSTWCDQLNYKVVLSMRKYREM